MDVIVRRCGKVWSDFVGKVLGGRERKRKERWLGEVLIFVCGNKGYGFTTGVGAVIDNNFRFFVSLGEVLFLVIRFCHFRILFLQLLIKEVKKNFIT